MHTQRGTAVDVRKDSSSPLAIALFVSAVALLVLVNRGSPAHAATPDTPPPARTAHCVAPFATARGRTVVASASSTRVSARITGHPCMWCCVRSASASRNGAESFKHGT